MFAGPNGSGKSALKRYLPSALIGAYLNPDEIQESISRESSFNLANYGIESDGGRLLDFITSSPFLRVQGLAEAAAALSCHGGKVDFSEVPVNAYFASAIADFLRRRMVEQNRNFTFESVMSHPGKVDLLSRARDHGYRTYLYYIATEDPEINISRVRNRVALGGHSVPEEKIVSRYHRSLDLLMSAIQVSDRAYIFDNSTDSPEAEHTWIAEITGGSVLEYKSALIPAWFTKAVLNRIP